MVVLYIYLNFCHMFIFLYPIFLPFDWAYHIFLRCFKMKPMLIQFFLEKGMSGKNGTDCENFN